METPIHVREMMFGTGEVFLYFQCGRCGSIQLGQIPDDMGKHYPSRYYSHQVKRRAMHKIGGRFSGIWTSLGRTPDLLCLARKVVGLAFFRTAEWQIVKTLSPCPATRFLDVGCGSGDRLRTLKLLGYTNLVGIDPYLSVACEESGLKLLKGEIYGIDGEFDIILFNHTLEHIPWPRGVLAKAHSLLPSGGFVVLRIPVTDTYAWTRYKENWVQLDAPRHVFLPSVKGLEKLAIDIGFSVKEILYDSNEFQFWGSEQYLRGIPLTSLESYGVSRRSNLFTFRQIRSFRRTAKMLNAREQGDQIIAFLEKS